jgi:drug/metabolite transporter (DMT)-like permease
MNWKLGLRQPGVSAALCAAVLFGSSTPLAKSFLVTLDPWLLAGLLYLGSGMGLGLYRWLRREPAVRLARADVPWFGGAIVAGGLIGPVLLMLGLRAMTASGASLLLNGETVFTTLLAWFAFRENAGGRVALGMAFIVAGAIVLSWPGELRLPRIAPALAVLGACFAWAVDNNLTRKVSLVDATWIASRKGLVAGSINLILAVLLGARWPPWPLLASTLVLGALAYGASLALFVVALRYLGTARTGAYFSVAPFFGTVLSILFLNEPVSTSLTIAGLLMACGVWLHLTEHHAHEHDHLAMEHQHEHEHDEHHQHTHEIPVPPGVKHSHWHRHEPVTHTHAHFPDAHHRHNH